MGDFLFGTVKAGDGGAVMVAAQLGIACAKLALPQVRVLLDGSHRPLQRLHMKTIDGAFMGVGWYLFACRLVSHGPSPSQCWFLGESPGLRDCVQAT
jgi:hypothetical protein